VHNFGTCKQTATANWQIPTNFVAKHVLYSEVAIPQRHFFAKGLNVLAKNRRNGQVNFIDSGLEVAKTKFQTFLWGKSVLFKWKCPIREFHAHGLERGDSQEKFLKGIVGDKRRLRF